MQPPSLYSHFASKNAIYDAMFEQAWRTVNRSRSPAGSSNLPAQPRASAGQSCRALLRLRRRRPGSLSADGCADHPELRAQPAGLRGLACEAYSTMPSYLPISDQADIDVYTALIAGLIAQQLANDPGGQRWRRLIPRVIDHVRRRPRPTSHRTVPIRIELIMEPRTEPLGPRHRDGAGRHRVRPLPRSTSAAWPRTTGASRPTAPHGTSASWRPTCSGWRRWSRRFAK